MDCTHYINQLYDIGAVQFGEFILKSGISSPIYIDLRRIISFPALLQDISALLWQKMNGLSFDIICGVPYTALPIATYISMQHNVPMVMRRKEAKSYGTGKSIEGVFQPGQQCLIIEDLITSGSSVLETIAPCEDAGLLCSDVVILIDREQGGKECLNEKGYTLHAAFSITTLIETLAAADKISQQQHDDVLTFIHATQIQGVHHG